MGRREKKIFALNARSRMVKLAFEEGRRKKGKRQSGRYGQNPRYLWKIQKMPGKPKNETARNVPQKFSKIINIIK